MRCGIPFVPLLLALFAFGCGGGRSASETGDTSLPPGPGSFTASPIALPQITQLEPLGWINPPGGHTLPTGHVYFYFNGPGPVPPPVSPPPVYPVYAPGSGTVIRITTATSGILDSRVDIQMTGTFSYFLGHVIPDAGVQVGTQVAAGQRLGQTNGSSGAVDLGVINEQITLAGFINPARYGMMIHHDSPYKYFTEPLRTQLYGMVKRTGADKDGRIDYDQPGRLIGNWFHESVPVGDSMGPAAWPKEICFVPDPNNPLEPRICLSSLLPLPGKWRPAAGSPAFESVSVATGKVAYSLLYLEGSTIAGLLLLQMESDNRVKIQVFPGSTATDGAFDGGALYYVR